MGMNKESIFELAVVDGEIVTMSKGLYDDIKQQLQAYKDKEDKLREYCKELNLASVSEDIEEILNERIGSDE